MCKNINFDAFRAKIFIGILHSGELRTIGNIKSNYEAYTVNGAEKKDMSKFKNVINKCLLEEDEDTYVLDLIPISELHHMMKVTTSLCDILRLDDSVKEFFKKQGIFWHGYNGGGLDGVNSNKVFKKLDQILDFVKEANPALMPIANLLEDFYQVVSCCFGMELDPPFKDIITKFNSKVEEVKMYLSSDEFLNTFDKGVRLSLGWKGHNLRFHLITQLDKNRLPLGIFSERANVRGCS